LTISTALTSNATPPAATQLNPPNSSTANSNNQLGPNSFITLLTAQLQAQDPLNPMDPSQMVNQLTQINSLQQLIQIQTDLQQVLGLTPAVTQTNATA
jgi:flagellar basal-body rod modification protein FlgD